jgi:hypothetical protein
MIPVCSRINSLRRFIRSASTPAGRPQSKAGSNLQALTAPRARGEWVHWRIAQFIAVISIQSPTREIMVPHM